MIKRNKIAGIFSIVITFILLCTSVFVPFFNKLQGKVFADGEDKNLYAFVSKQEDKAVNGKIYVDFGLSIDVANDDVITRTDAETMASNAITPFGSAKIYLRTRNMSAISEEGDYEAVNQTFTVSGTSPFTSIAIKVHNVGMQVGGVARQFYVEIYKVEITGLKDGYTFVQPNETKAISTQTLSTGAEFSIGQKTASPYGTNFTLNNLDLDYYSYLISHSECQDVTSTTSFKDVKIDLANISGGWYNKIKYLSDRDMLKMGIRTVLSAYEDPNGSYTDNSFVGLQMFGGDSKNVGAPALEGVPDKNVFNRDSVVEIARWFAKFQSDEREDLNPDTAFDGEFEDVTVGTRFNENVFITESLTKKDNQIGGKNYYGAGGVYDSYVGDMTETVRGGIFLIDDLDSVLRGSTTISTRVWKYLSSKAKYYSGYLMFIPTNYRAYVKNATFGQIYQDENGKDKVGVSLRFSEPVQFVNYKDGRAVAPYLEGYINGNAANELTFNYVSGVGTDTLFFETDVSNYQMNITRITLNSAHGFEDVYDFAAHAGSGGGVGGWQFLNVMDKIDGKTVNGWDTIASKTFSCSYDLRKPIINKNVNVSSTVKTSHTMTVSPENIGETGKLYYGWTTEKETVPENLLSNAISPQGFQTISSPSNISGVRYLYVLAVSELGKQSDPVWYGPFYFDNDKPTLTVESLNATENNYYKQKDFKITITNKSTTIPDFNKYVELKKNLKLYVTSDVDGLNIVKEISIPISDEYLKNQSVTIDKYTLTAEQLGLQSGSEKEYGEYYIFFSISDVLENQGRTQPISYYFDVRDIFSVTLVKNDLGMDEFAPGKLSLGEDYYTLDLSKIGENKVFTFSTKDSISMGIQEFVNVKTGVGVRSNVNATSSDGKIEISIIDKFATGLYRLTLKDNSDGSNKKSLPIYFYVTNGKVGGNGGYQEETGGYQSISDNGVLINKIFQIPTSVSYYYLQKDGTKISQRYGSVNKPVVFSSREKALEYILYCEYLDLRAITIDKSFADKLNGLGGIGDSRKAEDVTEVAKEGQVWIRYKERNWRANSTTMDWVYYYYSDVSNHAELPTINTNALSRQLREALETIANTICLEGEYIDLVMEEYLDAYGAPKLIPEQIPKSVSATKSNSETPFGNAVEYSEDLEMYVSLDSNAMLSTNTKVPFAENRYLYYKENDVYTLLIKDDRETFGEYINIPNTKKVHILELDENGVREYDIYIDHAPPKLTLSWVTFTEDGKENRVGDTLFASPNGFLGKPKVYIENLQDDDAFAFIAIYRYTGQGDLVYRVSDFKDGQMIALEDGKYHVYVSDRSGNGYDFVLQVKSTLLDFTVKEVDNSYIRVELLDREEEEIRYQVYLDGRLLTTDYRERKFTESGEYRFIIEDIYGNIYDHTYLFERALPTVTWSYQNADGNYVTYKEDNEQIKIQKSDDQNYVISTSTYLRFSFSLQGCVYEIISGNPNDSASSSGWIKLNNKVPFTMKVYYESHPETYVIYTCTVDDAAPKVNVSYEKEYYQAFEIKEIQEKFKQGGFEIGNNSFIPTSIGFACDAINSTTLYVTNGQKAQSKYFKVQVSDESGVKEVNIYCDDKLVLTKNSDFSNIYISRRGAYKIVATDNFGNTTAFTFVNDYEERVEYFVDGEINETDVAFDDYFVENTDTQEVTYTKVEYGKSQTAIRILTSAEVHYLITDADGKTYYFAFIVEDGKLYTFQYLVKIVASEKFDQEKGEFVTINEIENVSVRGINALTPGVVAEIDKIGVAISFAKRNDGTLLLTVHSTDEAKKAYTVETRISALDNQNEMPYYFKTIISTIPSSVELVDEDGNLIPILPTIKANKSFVIRDTIAPEIERVEVAFSATGNYTTYETVYDGTYHRKVFANEGMYHVKVVNRYGIQTDYYVVISSQFVMSAVVEYLDETRIEYSTAYTTKQVDFYSNKSIEFIVPATNITVLDKDEAISVTRTEQGYTSIYINTPGTYLLRIQDEYGNQLEKNIYIQANNLSIAENTLTHFNEEALRRDENFTNQQIFINEDAIYKSEIAFVSMRYGDSKITIYDNVSEKTTAFDTNQVIGALGDGEYTVIFRDIYGNKAETIIHYCGTPTLTILRNTLNSVGSEIYPMENLQDGVWTNDSVTFVVSATEYILTVDGMGNVKSITYDAKTKDEYEVEYLDEYGFKYTFTVHLHRADVVVTPAESMSVSQLSDLLVTKDSVAVHFTQDAHCYYTLNNEPERAYDDGEMLYKDGIYRFKVVDKAGNISTYTVKKDSAVEYRLEGAGAGEILLNGGVTNSHSVRFFAENADNVYIKKVFHNNEFIEYDDEIFTERGKWELLVVDDVGNESYFRFYILYGKIDGFIYNTPYNYEITSVLWEMEDASANATDTIKEQGLRLEATKNGTYSVTMKSVVTGDVQSFAFTIDKTPPQAELLGCQPNEKTINNITLKGCTVGDKIYVYKDGKLVKTVRIDSDYMDPPTISEAGKYKIIVENEAGVRTELSFERKYIPNFAGSVLIIVLALASVAGLFVGLVWRNHSKTDD